MNPTVSEAPAGRSFIVSLENRKRRGCGHERRAEIVTAARDLFLEHGVENVTTRQIAARVGISQTALYFYFGTKERILDCLAEIAWRGLSETLGAVDPGATGANSVGRLRATLAAFMRFCLDHPDDYLIVFMRPALRHCKSGEEATMTAFGERMLARLTDVVDKAAQAGGLRGQGSSRATALSIWAAVSGMVGLRLDYPEFPWPPERDQIEAMLDLVLNGCAERAAADPAAGRAPAIEPADAG
jgi:AcrR family transcriptional regulator